MRKPIARLAATLSMVEWYYLRVKRSKRVRLQPSARLRACSFKPRPRVCGYRPLSSARVRHQKIRLQPTSC